MQLPVTASMRVADGGRFRDRKARLNLATTTLCRRYVGGIRGPVHCSRTYRGAPTHRAAPQMHHRLRILETVWRRPWWWRARGFGSRLSMPVEN